MLKRMNWMIMMMVVLAMFWGCSSDDGTVTTPTPTQTAFEAMAAAGETYVNDTECPGVMTAQDLFDNLADYTVIDIRGQTDYDAGHISGAYHSSLGTLIADLQTIPAGKPYVVACYTGQSAGYAKIAMELLGYGDVYSLGFGMSSWNSSIATSWNNNCADELGNPETTNNNANLTNHAFPVLSGTPATIVQTRVAAVLQAGFQSKSYTDIRDNLGDYFVINYFGEADYLGQGTSGVPGHIPGAYQFTPRASLGASEMLKNIPTDQPVVVYCWTGQTSSQITAYLNMLGYEAYSLRFGSNNLFHSSLTAHQWSAASQNDFPLVTN